MKITKVQTSDSKNDDEEFKRLILYGPMHYSPKYDANIHCNKQTAPTMGIHNSPDYRNTTVEQHSLPNNSLEGLIKQLQKSKSQMSHRNPSGTSTNKNRFSMMSELSICENYGLQKTIWHGVALIQRQLIVEQSKRRSEGPTNRCKL